MPAVVTHHLNIGYRKRNNTTVVQKEMSLNLKAGELVCLIGPNGSGKSTLMRTIAGLQKPLSGSVFIDGEDVTTMKQHKKAKKIALVLTDRVSVENATVRDIVTMGRHPYSHWLGGLTDESKKKINEAIQLTHLKDKENHFFDELSDGEKQRVMVAKALAQDTPVVFLDEPTAHLDISNRVEIMLLLHHLAHSTNKAILISTHELDIALQAADRIWLLSAAESIIIGVPEDLVLNNSFNNVFGHRSYYFNTTNGNFSMNYPLTKKIRVEGDKTRLYWTLRALARNGYSVEKDATDFIRITEEGWIYNDRLFTTIEELLQIL